MPIRSNNTQGRLEVSSLVNYLFLVFVLTKVFFANVLKANFLNTASILLLFMSIGYAVLSNRDYMRSLRVTPILFWALWVIYSYINWEVVGIRPEGKTINFVLSNFIYPIVIMCLVYYEGSKEPKRTTLVVIAALAAYVILGLLFQDNSVDNGWEAERGGHQLGNSLPLNACVLTFFAVLAYAKGWIGKRWLMVILLLTLGIILFVATRKALVGWAIILGVSFFGRFKFEKPSDWLRVLLLLVAAIVAYNFLMNHTYLGVRMQETIEQGMEINETDVEALNYLGDRAMQYAWAWEEFLKHPLTGIGICNYQAVTGSYFRLHTEYMVQLCECGIIGAILFLLFVLGMFGKIFKSRSQGDNKLLFVCLGGLLCILSISFTAWTYSGCHYFAMYGMILALCHPTTVASSAPSTRRYSILDSPWVQLPVPRLRFVFALRHVGFVLTERVCLCVRYVAKGVSQFVRGVGDAVVGFGSWCWRIPMGAYRFICRFVRNIGGGVVGIGVFLRRTVSGVYGGVRGLLRGVRDGMVGFGNLCWRIASGVYVAVSRFVRIIGGGLVAFGTTLWRTKGVWYAFASVAALAVVGLGIWFGVSHFNSLPHSELEPESQLAEVTIDTTQVPDDTYEDELDYSTVVEDNTGRLLCVVPQNWEKGFDLVISWRCNTPDVCFQIRPVGTERWTTMRYNDTGKSNDIIPFTLQKEFLASGNTLEWRLFARFPDNTTVVKSGFVTLVN